MSSMLGDAIAHHLWATEQLMETCRGLTPEQLDTPAIGTYGPIMQTLRHLVHSDHWYLSFFIDLPELTDGEVDAMGLDELRSIFAVNGAAWLKVVAEEHDPDRDIVEIGGGWEFHAPAGVRLAQVIHHGTDHRSQICTALTSIGVEPPEIDVWAYARATERDRAVRQPEKPT